MQHKTTLNCYPLHHTPCITTRKAAFTSLQYIICSCMPQLCQYCKFLMKTPEHRLHYPNVFLGGCAPGPPLRLWAPLTVLGGWAAKCTAPEGKTGQKLSVCHFKVLATLPAGASAVLHVCLVETNYAVTRCTMALCMEPYVFFSQVVGNGGPINSLQIPTCVLTSPATVRLSWPDLHRHGPGVGATSSQITSWMGLSHSSLSLQRPRMSRWFVACSGQCAALVGCHSVGCLITVPLAVTYFLRQPHAT
jgi:hypothetical protein